VGSTSLSRGHRFRGASRRPPQREDERGLQFDQLGSEGRQAIRLPLGAAVLDDNVVVVIAEVVQTLTNSLQVLLARRRGIVR